MKTRVRKPTADGHRPATADDARSPLARLHRTVGTRTGRAPAGGGSSVTERDLLDPLVHINRLLRAYASAEGHVRSPATGAPDTAASLVHHSIPAMDVSGAR